MSGAFPTKQTTAKQFSDHLKQVQQNSAFMGKAVKPMPLLGEHGRLPKQVIPRTETEQLSFLPKRATRFSRVRFRPTNPRVFRRLRRVRFGLRPRNMRRGRRRCSSPVGHTAPSSPVEILPFSAKMGRGVLLWLGFERKIKKEKNHFGAPYLGDVDPNLKNSRLQTSNSWKKWLENYRNRDRFLHLGMTPKWGAFKMGGVLLVSL